MIRSEEEYLQLKETPSWVWLGPFFEGVQAAFEIQFGNPIRRVERISGEVPKNIPLDIYALIAIRGETFLGECVLGFAKTTYLALLKKVFDEDHAEITPENQDGTGEIVNIIFGKAKADLNKIGYGIQMARPEVKTVTFPLRQSARPEDRYLFLLETEIGKVFFSVIRGAEPAAVS